MQINQECEPTDKTTVPNTPADSNEHQSPTAISDNENSKIKGESPTLSVVLENSVEETECAEQTKSRVFKAPTEAEFVGERQLNGSSPEEFSGERSANGKDVSDGYQLIERPVSSFAAEPEGKRLSSTASPIKSSKKDTASGYLSDGEVLLKTTSTAATLRLFDDNCLSGYISEGSSTRSSMNAARYSSRSQRAGERMPVVDENSRLTKTQDSSAEGDYDR